MAQKLYGKIGTPGDSNYPANRTEGNFDRPGFLRKMYRMIKEWADSEENPKNKKKKKGTMADEGKAATGAVKKHMEETEKSLKY